MATTDQVDTDTLLILFSQCRQQDGTLLTDAYANAYQETCKLLKLFGTVFGFVSSDIEERITILRDYRSSEVADQYTSVQSMIEYEVANQLTDNRSRTSAVKTLLPLHRALQFITVLLLKLRDTDNEAVFSTAAIEAYDATLAQYYSWIVNKGVHVAMKMLPSRPELLKKMNLDETEEKMALLTQLIDELNAIHGITEDLYAKDNLLTLEC